jgi:AcrR family transcriptional regulator
VTEADSAPRTRNPSATKARLLEAATEEFAAHGIAGARIDRIEAAARANRSLIYSYFTNKDGLFDAVMDAAVARVLDEVPFTPEDLPGYVGQLFDFLGGNPNLLRLAMWHRLERAGSGRETAGLSDSHRLNVASVTEARAESRSASGLSPEDLYVFTLALASAWAPASPHVPAALATRDLAAHRAAIVEATRRITAPHAASPLLEPSTTVNK